MYSSWILEVIFAPSLRWLVEEQQQITGLIRQRWKLIGVVEDTENGHQKYNEALQRFGKTHPPVVYSVARSRMKSTEDYNVGKSLVRAADSILRQSLDLRLEEHAVVGVIGFGKIGSSIASHMRQQQIGKVMVYDVNPAILLCAAAQDFVICSKDQLLQEASFVFCATGNKALTFHDLLHVGTKVERLVIASCTSADDELDLSLMDQYEVNPVAKSNDFGRYCVPRANGKSLDVILLCHGNATNFSRQAVLGEYIRAVQAAMMVCALKLCQSEQTSSSEQQHNENEIRELSAEEEKTIARLWLQNFPKLEVRLITNVWSATTRLGQDDLDDSSDSQTNLPIDRRCVRDVKEKFGLQRSTNTASVDFMDSECKLADKCTARIWKDGCGLSVHPRGAKLLRPDLVVRFALTRCSGCCCIWPISFACLRYLFRWTSCSMLF